MSENLRFEAFEELRLKNFRAFRDARLVLNDLTVLVGRNGAGKSTILEALDFIRDATTDSLRTAVDRRGGFAGLAHRSRHGQRQEELSIALQLRVSVNKAPMRLLYGFTLEADGDDGGFAITREVLETHPGSSFGFARRGIQFECANPEVSPSLSDDGLLLPLISGQDSVWRVCDDAIRGIRTHSLTPSALRLEPVVGDAKRLQRDGLNVGDVLNRLQFNPETLQWIVAHLALVADGIVGVRARAAAGRRLIQFEQETDGGEIVTFPAAQMSDGTLRCLATLVALRQEPAPTLLFIDEIEDSIHPMALAGMMDAVVSCLDRSQVILSSHSPDMLMHEAATEARTRMILWQNGVSWIHGIEPAPPDLAGYPFSVGELLQSNGLPPSSEPVCVLGDFFEVRG